MKNGADPDPKAMIPDPKAVIPDPIYPATTLLEVWVTLRLCWRVRLAERETYLPFEACFLRRRSWSDVNSSAAQLLRNCLRESLPKTGPLRFGSENRFPLNFAHEYILVQK